VSNSEKKDPYPYNEFSAVEKKNSQQRGGRGEGEKEASGTMWGRQGRGVFIFLRYLRTQRKGKESSAKGGGGEKEGYHLK